MKAVNSAASNLTWNDDMTKIPLVGDVIDAEPSDVEDGQLARKRKLHVLVDVLPKRLEVAELVRDLWDQS